MNNDTSTIKWPNYSPNPKHFADRIFLITGAADGIGRAVSIALASLGATVLMLDRKTRRLEKLYDHIVQARGQEPVILPIDLMDLSPESATAVAQAIADDFGRLDGLLHNAAELGSPSPMDQYDLEYWEQVMQTNLHAPYLLTRALLPLLKQETTTSVLFSSASIGRNPTAFGGAYSIAYAGVEAQMQIWAQELEKTSKIRVNSVDPGPVRTVMRRRSHPGENQADLISPQEISLAYLMLLSGEYPFHGEKLSLQDSIST